MARFQQEDTYMEPIVYQSEHAIVRVFRPILTPEERARRMKQIHDAAADLIRVAQQTKAGVQSGQ